MTFEAFVDAVDAALCALAGAEYGVFRGPHVTFWQRSDVTARLREGANGDAELEVAGAQGAPVVVVPCDAGGAAQAAAAIAAAWV